MTTRRDKGAGSVYLRSDGRWEGKVDLGRGADGKRHRKAVYARSRVEAVRKMRAVRDDHARGLRSDSDQITVADYLERWLVVSVEPKLAPSTSTRYAELVHLHIIPTIGGIRLKALNADAVQDMLNAKVASGLAPRTVWHIRSVLRRALGQAVRWRKIAYNVAAETDPPRVERYRPTVLNPAQGSHLLEAVKGDRLEAVVTMALATGVRIGEALGLQWGDVHLGEDGTPARITIQRALQRSAGSLRIVAPKTQKSGRTLRLPDFAVQALLGQRTRQKMERLAMGTAWKGPAVTDAADAFVFTNSVGKPIDPTNLLHAFQRLVEAAGLPKMRFHDLRHGAASTLLARGVHPKIVAELLGHSQISITLDTYSHVLPDLMAGVADEMEAVYGSRSG